MTSRLAIIVFAFAFLSAEGLLAQVDNFAAVDSGEVYTAIDLLRIENDLLRQHNEEVLDTVKWAVGGIFTLIAGALVLFAVVAGVNIFQFNRRYSEDKASLRSELETDVSDRFKASTTMLSEQAEASRKNLVDAVDEKISSKTESLRYSIESSQNSLRGEFDQMRLEIKLDELKKIFEEEYVNDFALLTTSQALKLTHTAEYGWLEQSDILNMIRKIIKKLSTKKSTIDPDRIVSLYDELDRLEKYEEEVVDIKEMIRKARNT